MIRHIVLFQLKGELSTSVKSEVMESFRQGILSLPEKIKSIVSIEVGINVNPDEAWDICLSGTFASMDDVRSYAVNPLHTAIAGELKRYLQNRSCVDYEF